jgi:predicted acetyltransferase
VPGLEIRPLTPADDMAAQVDLGERAFGPYSAAQRANWVADAELRVSQQAFLGAFVDGAPAGAAIFHDMRQWWAGRAVPCAGVASVKVAPEHRGRGIGRRLMTAALDAIAARGYPLSVLFPATMPLYRSLGWELAGGRYQATIPARSLRTLMPPDAAASGHGTAGSGTAGHGSGGHGSGGHGSGGHGAAAPGVRRASAADAAAVIETIGRVHEAARDSGPVTWDTGPAERWLARPDLYAYRTDDGFAAYRWARGNEELFVERVQAATPESARALWAVIASHASIASTIRAVVAPNDPFWWLTRERDATITKRSMWMLRVVDAPAAIAARGFPAAVSVSVPLVISDHARPVNSGSWRLSVSGGKGMLIPDERGILPTADAALTLGARGFAALYAGTPTATLRLAGLASGGSPGTDAALDAAFAATAFMLDDF